VGRLRHDPMIGRAVDLQLISWDHPDGPTPQLASQNPQHTINDLLAEGRAVAGEEAFHGSAERVALAVADPQLSLSRVWIRSPRSNSSLLDSQSWTALCSTVVDTRRDTAGGFVVLEVSLGPT
jgi:hypothetical protein